MAILVTCGACGAKLRVRDEYLGKEVWCPACKAPLTLTGERVPNHEVFVSYSNKDKAVADAICATLEEKKIRCWIAPRDISAGNSWGGSIIEAIEDAQVMVLVYSGHSNLSPQVIREVERAVAKGLLIVPVRIEAAPMSKDMEYFLSSSHWFDAINGPLEKHLAQFAEMVRLILFKNAKAKEATPVADCAPTEKPRTKTLPWKGAAVAILGVILALGAFLWVRQHKSHAVTSPTAISPISSEWLSFDIAADCTADIISTDSHRSADQFTYDGGRLASASWQRQNGYPEPGLPEDGRVQIPDTNVPGFFKVRMPPAKNAILLSGPEGAQPEPITVELATYERRHYAEVAVLHCTCWGHGTLRVLLRYETGAEVYATIPVVDCRPGGRTGSLPAELRVAVPSRCINPNFGHPAELFAQRIPADPGRVLRSLTFLFESLMPPNGDSEQDARSRFTVAIFAISGQAATMPATVPRLIEPPTVQPRALVPIPVVVAPPAAAQLRQQWTNSLGMIFVPVAGTSVQFPIWDTRVQDYQAFVKVTGRSWQTPPFEQGPTHPAVNVNWGDAAAFCQWLTEQERQQGRLGNNQFYRLPKDWEWSVAVGLNELREGWSQDKDGKIKNVYPWDQGRGTWPPPQGAGNYDPALEADSFAKTSPVGSFKANQHGLFDMGGNVWQWCEDYYDEQSGSRILRGGSWLFGNPGQLLSAYRRSCRPELRNDISGFRCVLASAGAAAP